ncbi:hypothetical protein [Geotalea uraniireducens]|uniref:Uncharacterized protein n=1 Tax=Geotalea uraniireducens (strain Rf4) TaxID=351605 RepID=A5G6U6_GEOUR|nr:hypothetical protein [Geotalea uraniireducens]ABQ27514.1 hypothetical protein Gura_3357 [Geotalea uraniireducens Rf4]
MKTLCPFCDSDNTEKISVTEHFPIPFDNDVQFVHEQFRCNDCEEEGDFDNSYDRDLTKAITKANLASAPALMDSLVKSGKTMVYVEKALRLPYRTTARWKRGRISHSALALLRLIRFSPDLLELADDNFSEHAQAKYRLKQLCIFFDRHTINTSGSYNATDGKKELILEGSFLATPIVSSYEPKSTWGVITK